jgi:hypothetical protein
VNDAWHLAKIKGFEQVIAAPGIALLRVVAKPPRRRSSSGARPTLLADDGHVVNRYAPLPSPADPKGVLRAAYSVPEGFITPETVFSLELEDGAVLSLPGLTPGAARAGAPERQSSTQSGAVTDGPDAVPVIEVEGSDRGESDAGKRSDPPGPPGDRRSDLMGRIVELSAAVTQHERDASEQRAAREAMEAALQAASEQAEAARIAGEAELRSVQEESAQRIQAAREETEERIARAQLEAERGVREAQEEIEHLQALEQATRTELQSRIEEAQASADAAESRAARAVAREQEARVEAATAREAFDGFQRRIAGLEISLREHGDQIAVLEADLAEAVRMRDDFEQEAVNLRAERTRLERELHDALDSVRKMAIERDELGRQAAAFDQVAIKARERAVEFETAHQQSQATLNELETWRGELERRLSSMSSELGEARARLTDNDRELTRLRGELAEAEARAELAHAQIIALSDAAVGNDAGTIVIDRAALDRMAGELASLRADSARADQELDAATWMRIREVEAEREELAHRVAELTGMLEKAERLAELAQELSTARRSGEPGAPTDSPRPTASAGAATSTAAGPDLSSRSAQEQAGISALSARAEAEAEEIAARELAQATAGQTL